VPPFVLAPGALFSPLVFYRPQKLEHFVARTPVSIGSLGSGEPHKLLSKFRGRAMLLDGINGHFCLEGRAEFSACSGHRMKSEKPEICVQFFTDKFNYNEERNYIAIGNGHPSASLNRWLQQKVYLNLTSIESNAPRHPYERSQKEIRLGSLRMVPNKHNIA
jgi:hypothetical protein